MRRFLSLLRLKSFITNKPITAFVILLILIISQFCVADQLNRTIPADALFAVRINNLDSALASLDQYLMGVSPVGVSMLARMQIAQMLGDPMLNGIDTTGSFGIFAVAVPSAPNGEIVILAPLSDLQTFTSQNPSCSSPDAKGIYTISPPQSALGELIAKPTSDNKFLVISNKANAAEFDEVLETLPQASLSASLDEAQTAEATSSPLWAYANVERLNDQFGQELTAKFEGIKQQMSGAAAMGSPVTSAEQMTKIFDIYFMIIQGFLEQSDNATLTTDVNPGLLAISVEAKARPGTKMAELLVDNPINKQGFKLANKLNEPAAVNFLAYNHPSMVASQSAFFEALAEAVPEIGGANINEWQNYVQQYNEAAGDEIALSMNYVSQIPFFEFTEIIQVRDAEKFKEVMNHGFSMANVMYEAMGMPMSINESDEPVETYKNFQIQKVLFNMNSGASGDNNSQSGFMPAEMQMFNNMQFYSATSSDNFYLTMGPGAVEKIKKLIDSESSAGAGGTANQDIQTAMATISYADEADFIGSYNYLKMMAGMSGMMKQMNNPAAPMFDMFSEANLNTSSCMAFAGKISDGKFKTTIALPKQHLMEIANIMMQLQQQMMQQQQQMPPDQQNIPRPTLPSQEGGSSPQSAEPHAEQLTTQLVGTVVPGEKVGPVEFGMSRQEVVNLLGSANLNIGKTMEFRNKGMTVMFDNGGKVKTIMCGHPSDPDSPLVYNCPYRTARGVGIHSSQHEVIASFGAPTTTMAKGPETTLSYVDIGAKFTLYNDELIHMSFRRNEE